MLFRSAEGKDGEDLSDLIKLDSTPSLDFKNGQVVPDKAGSYELTYSVTDDDGMSAEAYSTLTVTKKTSEEILYKDFDFSTEEVKDTHGWEFKLSDNAEAEAKLEKGAYVLSVESPGEGDGDVQLVKPGFKLEKADYKVKIWAKSDKETYAHILARDEKAEEWKTFGGAFNVEIGPKLAPLEMDFSSEGEGSAELMFNVGKITPNPDNPDDTTPENFTIVIDKIEIYKITGEQTKVKLFKTDFTDGVSAEVEAGDGAEASLAGANEVSIASYPAEGGVWSIKADVALEDVKIEKDQKYYYVITLESEADQGGEILVESKSQYDKQRVSFSGLTAAAGEEVQLEGQFTAENPVDDPTIRFQIGDPAEGVTTNKLLIHSVEFGKLEGDLETEKMIDSFMAFGSNTSNGNNPDKLWETFNGTDEDHDKGVGTIWTEDGSLFYRIDDGGTVDWHNKLIFGYTGNPLVLQSDSYYTIEIKARADENISAGVFLNPLGGWDPRIAESIDLTPEAQTFTYKTDETFVMDMDFELLFQFGSEELSNLDDVTIEIEDMKIYQTKVQ